MRRSETRRCNRVCAWAAFPTRVERVARSSATSATSKRSSANVRSERALKERDLRQYDILHLAAHAISDESHPERSAVLLSAGAENEDGLLQAREIEGLDLEGRIVVLSACRTVSGAVLSGEGVLSLARAFFEAGAHAVIGSRWPIRDQDAASFFDVFYRRLGEGASLSEALMQAKAEAIAAGRPAAAWASVVLLGDGDFRPFPQGRPAVTPRLKPAAALVVAIVALLLALGAFRRHSPTPSPRTSPESEAPRPGALGDAVLHHERRHLVRAGGASRVLRTRWRAVREFDASDRSLQ